MTRVESLDTFHVENFTSQPTFLAKRVEGDWIFKDLGNGQPKIEWTYKIVPKHIFARGVINLFLLKNVNGLLTNALIILKTDLETD